MLLAFIEFRPFRFLLFVLGFGLLRAAAHGDLRAVVICSVCAMVLFWRPLLDAARQVREAAYEVQVFIEWAWDRLTR